MVAYMYGSLRTLLLLRNNVILDLDTNIILCLYHINNHIICIYIVFFLVKYNSTYEMDVMHSYDRGGAHFNERLESADCG